MKDSTELAIFSGLNWRRAQRRKINVSQVFAGQKVGVKQVDEHI
jgi:hypothetical protein